MKEKIMKKSKITRPPIELFTLDLTDALLPKAWPVDIPLILRLQTGQYGQDYDIIPSDEPWYESLLKFVKKQQYTTKDDSLPISVRSQNMHVGAKVYDANQKIVAQGKDRLVYLKEIEEKKESLEKILVPLREKFLGIKDKYLIDFNETQESLLETYRPFTDAGTIFDVLNDIMMSSGASTYKDGSLASLGAYNSLIDFEVLNCILNLFNKEELVLLESATRQLSYLTPIHSVINGQVKSRNEKSTKPKMK